MSDVSIACILLVLNSIFWYFILHDPRHLVNYILPFFQFTSGLCLTNQSCSKNMSTPFKSITATSMYSLYLLILISSGATFVTFLFLVPSVLYTLNEKFIGLVYILLSLTSCLSIPMWVHLESTSASICNSFPFFVLIFTCMLSSFSLLFLW